MGNPFRRKSAEESFPKPQWPPIQDLDSIDVFGRRRDGGVDLAIVASQPIDDSPQTLESIRHKVRTYLRAIGLEAFQAEMGHPPREKTTIFIVCEHPIHPKAWAVIGECQVAAAAQGVRLEVNTDVGSTPAAPGRNSGEQTFRPPAPAVGGPSVRRRSGDVPEHTPDFRDFGILPEGLQPPPERVRCFLSTGRVVGQYIGTGIVSALGLGLAVLLALTMPVPLNLLGCAAALTGFGAFVYLATHNDYRWVELEGNTLRARRLYTGRMVERSVDEIESLGTMVYQVRQLSTVVVEKFLGRVKGIEVRFRDRRTPLRILRADPAMTNARELIEAVLYRMGQLGDLDAEIVQFAGQPLVRHIHWKGERPSPPPGKNLKLALCCLILMALMFGTIIGYAGLQDRERYLVGSVPPQTIALDFLIRNGPGANRHVTLTDFRPGGYTVEKKSGSWTTVWVALFPAGARAGEPKEIQVVLSSKSVRDEAALRQLLRGPVTGICSKDPSSSWGMTLGPNLVKANKGRPLSAAWSVEELREPPSAAAVTGSLTTSGGCFAAAIILALIIFWKAT